MLAQPVFDEVCRLLDEDELSQRQIAERTGVSRTTIRAIESERLWGKTESGPAEELPSGPPSRCSTCGALVHAPCLLCRMRKALTGVRRVGPNDEPDEPVQLQLKEHHRRRYDEVRAWHEQGIFIGEPKSDPPLPLGEGRGEGA